MFERRGDPWLTPREAMAEYKRDLSREDPDFDRYYYAGKPKPRPSYTPPKGVAVKPTYERRAVNIVLKGRAKMK